MTFFLEIPSNPALRALGAMLVLALATPAHASSAASDAWITTKVKLSLATEDGALATQVNVDTVSRRVTLHGSVHTAAEKESAQRIANGVAAVEGVRNLLQVVPAARENAVAVKDQNVRTRVVDALTNEPSLKDDTVSVQSVNNGLVLLGGNTGSLSDHLTAVQIARSVKGVRRVASDIHCPDTLADSDMWKEANVAVGGRSAQSAGGAARDLYTTSMVKMRLLADGDTPAMDINVDTRNRTVTLFGIVGTAQSKAAAEAQARQVAGVDAVDNQLQVVTSGKQAALQVKDDAMAIEVRKNFDNRSDLGGVSVEVKNCVVRLTGAVPSGIERAEAMQLARATTGVCSVSDALTLQ